MKDLFDSVTPSVTHFFQDVTTSYLGLCTHLTITFFSSGLLFRRIVQFTRVLALYGPFGVDVSLKFDITHSHRWFAGIVFCPVSVESGMVLSCVQ